MSDTPNPTSQAVAEAVAELGVTFPTPADPLADAIADAEGQGQTPDPQPPPASPEPPATETKPDDKPPAAPNPDAPANEDEMLGLTAEDYEKVQNDPTLLKFYKSMRRGLTSKTTALAETRKAHEADLDIMTKVRSDPRAAIQALAQAAGIPVSFADASAPAGAPPSDAAQAAIDDAIGQLDKVLTPEGSTALKPVLLSLMKAVAAQAVAPYQRTAETMQEQTARAGLNATIKSFGAERLAAGEEWSPEVEKEMAKLVGVVLPGPGMTHAQYIGHLYDQVAAKRIRAAAAKREFDRLQSARAAAEPTRASRTPAATAPTAITSSMTRDEQNAAAVRAALAEMREG